MSAESDFSTATPGAAGASRAIPAQPPVGVTPDPAPPVAAAPAGRAAGRSLRIDLVEFMPSGGMFQFAFQLGEALAAAGHRVRLLTGPRPELRSGQPNFEVVELFPTWHPNEGLQRPRSWRRLRRLGRAVQLLESWRRLIVTSRREAPDVVHLGEFRFPMDSVGAGLLARLGRCGIVADTAHNPLPFEVGSGSTVEKAGPVTVRALSWAYASMDLVFALGDGPAGQLREHFPTAGPTVVCGHGDYVTFAAGRQPQSAGQACRRVLFFGSWTRYKNLDLLLDAFPLVREQVPDAVLVMAGPVMDDVDLPALAARAAGCPGIELRPGYVPIADLPALFDESRVVALPYEVVNISGVVHLAYSFARPVVATDVGSMRDVVHPGRTGYLTEATPQAFADALAQLLRDPLEAGELGSQARAFVAGSSSWAAVAAKVAEGYRAALEPA